MMRYYGLDWVGTILGLASIHYLGQRRRLGFVLRIAASIFWALFGIVASTPACVIANVAVIVLSFRGLRAWKAESRSVGG